MTAGHPTTLHMARCSVVAAALLIATVAWADEPCEDASGVVVEIDNEVSDAAHVGWTSHNWTCADFAGYKCAIGGWGVVAGQYAAQKGGGGEGLRQRCPTSCLDGRCTTQSMVPTPTCMYIFGLESSGTKYVSHALSKLLHFSTTWDGQNPACWSYRGHSIQHISLPHGESCAAGDAEGGMRIVAEADMCEVGPESAARDPPRTRWIVNVTSTLLAAPSCKAIVVTRSSVFQRMSKLFGHGCGSASADGVRRELRQFRKHMAWRREDSLSRQMIVQAFDHFGAHGRIIAVPYEELEWLGSHHWGRISAHAGVSEERLARWVAPSFSSADGKWLERAQLAELKRVATPMSHVWDEGAWAVRLAKVRLVY